MGGGWGGGVLILGRAGVLSEPYRGGGGEGCIICI